MKKVLFISLLLLTAVSVIAQPGEPGPVDGGLGLLIAGAAGLVAWKMGRRKKQS